MTNMTMPYHKNSCPCGNNFLNFGRPFLGHHNYILILSDRYLETEKKVFEEMMYSYIDFYGHPLAQLPLLSRS